MNLQQGDMIGAYQIDSVLGQGGMASVYKAYHERLDRFVAIKLMHATFLQDEDFQARFQREARIVARLEHPAIVPIYDYNEHNGIPYLVMKFVPGMTLKRKAIKSGLTLSQTYTLLKDIADGLDYAHSMGILHRDMKPSNILIDEQDRPFITDFGLARIAEAGASTISHDMMLGTPFYISPEQAQGSKDLDNRTDIYSLAVILYELITGKVPFEADTPYAIVHGHIYTPPKPPGEINAQLTPAIDAVLLRGLAKQREERYPTARALIDAFGAALNGEQPVSLAVSGDDPANTSRYDDLGDDVLPTVIERTPVRPQRKAPRNRVENPIPQEAAEFNLDMADLSWDNIRQGIKSGVSSLAEMIEERIDTELRNRRGIEYTEEERARRRVLKRMKARSEFVAHLSSYITVNGILIAIWFFTGSDFFWPFFPLFFWGIGVVGQGWEYYSKYGPGAARREELIEQEVARELSRSGQQAVEKPKKQGGRLSLEEMQGGGVRLNDEGELTDSFVEEQRSSRKR